MDPLPSPYLSYSLHSLKRVLGGIKGNSRSLDYSSLDHHQEGEIAAVTLPSNLNILESRCDACVILMRIGKV